MLATVANFHTRYPQLGTSSDEDAAITELLNDAGELIAAFSGYPAKVGGGFSMEVSSYQLFSDGPSFAVGAALCACVRPIVTVTSVHADTTRVYAAGALLVEGTDFTVDSLGGVLIRTYPNSWPTGYRAVKLVLTAGYATTPPGLRAIACAAARHLWDQRAVAGQDSYSFAGGSASLSDAERLLPASVKDALESGWMTPCGLARLMAMRAAA